MNVRFLDSTCHKNTLTFAVINLFGSLMPLWLLALLLLAFSKWTTGQEIWNNGEFYLYSSALITQSAFILFNYKSKNYDLYAILGWISVIILIISAALFSGLTTSIEIFKSEKILFDQDFLFVTSISAFSISVIIFYFASYIQNFDQDLGMKHRNQIDAIKDGLH